ncbi:CD225/dispanin family protein [Thermodesulfobacteriota bacterium]
MFCSKCGKENEDVAVHCFACGEPLSQNQPQAPGVSSQPIHVPNYLVQAILVTIFCCLPFGIVAIIFAAQVNGKLQAGDVSGATESSRKAKMWSWISFGIGLGIFLIYIIITLIVVIGSEM